MPRDSLRLRQAALALAVMVAAGGALGRGATLDSYIGPDGGVWTDSGNWSLGVVPNSGSYDVQIGSALAVTVQLNANETINNMSVSVPDTLSLLATLTLAGSVQFNSGTLLFDATAPHPTIYLNGSATLSGQGAILLGSTGSSITGGAAMRLTTDNVISGQGNIGGGLLKLTNTGTISSVGSVLTVAPTNATDGFINNGALLADGGTLSLLGKASLSPLTNTNGVIEALAGSVVSISNMAISGGLLQAQSGGSITLASGCGLSNVSLDGLIQIPRDTVTVSGTITNDGLLQAGMGYYADLSLSADCKFTGSGTIVLNNFGIRVPSAAGTMVRFTNQAVISGCGSIGDRGGGNAQVFVSNSGTITASNKNMGVYLGFNPAVPVSNVNSGLLQASGVTLRLGAGGLDNSSGVIEAMPNSLVQIELSNLAGGVVRAQPGGTVTLTFSTVVSNASFSGLIQAGNLASFMGSISNAGTLAMGSCVVGQTGSHYPPAVSLLNTGVIQVGQTGGAAGTLTQYSDVVLSGGGTFALNNGAVSAGANDYNMRLTTDNMIIGCGSFGLNHANNYLTNTGTISAAGGSLTLQLGVFSYVQPQFNYNRGRIGADGGTLIIGLPSSILDNTDGIIEAAANSVVSINYGRVQGGTVRALDGGTLWLGNCGLRDLSIQGLVQGFASQFRGVVNLSGSTTVTGSAGVIVGSYSPWETTILNNAGMLQLGYTSGGPTMEIDGDVFLTGGGSVTLDRCQMTIGGPSRLTSDNLLVGYGTLGSTWGRIFNDGTISAMAGILSVTTTPTANSFINTGTIRADGGTLNISANLSAAAGTIEAVHGGVVNFSSGAYSIGCPIVIDSGVVNFSNSATGNAASIAGNGMLSVSSGAVLTSDGVNIGQLSVAGSHIIRVNGSATGTSRIQSITMATMDGAYTATLDLNDNRFILQADPLVAGDKEGKAGMLQGALWSGEHGGDWMGTGITSSTVAADASGTGAHRLALGLFDNADLGLSSFGGQGVDSNSLLIETVVIGDSDRNGVVDGVDFGNWYAHRGEYWVFTEDGDFNRDGGVDGRDFDLWYGAAGDLGPATLEGLGLDRGAMSAVTVPEGGTVGVLVAGVMGVVVRRRRRRAGGEVRSSEF